MGNKVLSAAVVVIGLFMLMTTKGAILGFPISLIAVVVILIGGYRLVRARLYSLRGFAGRRCSPHDRTSCVSWRSTGHSTSLRRADLGGYANDAAS